MFMGYEIGDFNAPLHVIDFFRDYTSGGDWFKKPSNDKVDSPRLASIEERLAALEAKTARINDPRTLSNFNCAIYSTNEIDGDRS